MSQRARKAVSRWRDFAETLTLNIDGKPKTWKAYIRTGGYVDEERIIQPTVFPAFAEQLLGWTLQVNLAPEESGAEGKPDFTPADSVTHPFVFETKSTNKGPEIRGDDAQVKRYLTDGAPRIKTVLLTNLVGARVLTLDDEGELHERYNVPLGGLLYGTLDDVANLTDASHLADLLEEFSRKELTLEEKIQRIRSAPPWNPVVEVTSSDWILRRIDRIVALLTGNVMNQIREGVLLDPSRTAADERKWITEELRLLASRLGQDSSQVDLQSFIDAKESSLHGKALQQFAAHVAYYAATRLMLVRVWEDLQLLQPMLHDGGFDRQMTRFENVLPDVIDHSFKKARDRYRALFDQRNSYTWFVPNDETYTEVIYELANTYLGAIQSDVLGQVYERMLERIDRKLLGVYYTPRDIIGLIWDLIGFDRVADEAEKENREPRVLDIATGSGGFLVEAARRLRFRVAGQLSEGASVGLQDWINETADGLNGIELNRFSAYLAELNLLVQFGQVIAGEKTADLRLPAMGILSGDTLSLHDPVDLLDDWRSADVPNDLIAHSEDRRERARKIKVAAQADFLMDVACGNPPYIGEKTAATMLARTRRDYPYWESFVGQHMDYLYWFLILGVSKLRKGGRFGFITTEYWLRAEGAKPLRMYLASRCEIDRVVLFRDFRLFPDAPGQHSMIVTGTRVAAPDATLTDRPKIGSHKPKVSIYEGGPVPGSARPNILKAIKNGSRAAANVRTFNARLSPNDLGSGSWADTILTQSQLSQRSRLAKGDQIELDVTEGVITTANGLSAKVENLLSGHALAAAGGPGSKPGIQLISANEAADLGTLTDAERDVVRQVVNTSNVYPYAVVVPDDSDRVIYLPKPPNPDRDVPTEIVLTGTPFPPDMPALEAHLTRFRSLLEAKARDWGERRPWWSLHRARAEVVGDAGLTQSGWADYCVVSRWGVGQHLCVARAPASTSPASGLHVLRAHKDVVPASYLAALYNSTLYQEIAESLAPGQLRKADLQAIGVPLRQTHVEAITESADRLSQLVTDIVKVHTQRFPELAQSLRADVALKEMTDSVWSPKAGSTRSWGTLGQVGWMDQLSVGRAGSTKLGTVQATESLLGHQIEISVRGSHISAAVITLGWGAEEDVTRALAAVLRGVANSGGTIRDLVRVPASNRSEGSCHCLPR